MATNSIARYLLRVVTIALFVVTIWWIATLLLGRAFPWGSFTATLVGILLSDGIFALRNEKKARSRVTVQVHTTKPKH